MEFVFEYLIILVIISVGTFLFILGNNALINKKKNTRAVLGISMGLFMLIIGSLNTIFLIMNDAFSVIIGIMFMVWNLFLLILYIHFSNFNFFKKFLMNKKKVTK